MIPLLRRLLAEGLGSALLFATVIGSGIMAERLAGGNDAVALLGNTLATAAMLLVLITTLGPISGAHMNPAVTLVAALRRELTAVDSPVDGLAIVAPSRTLGKLAEIRACVRRRRRAASLWVSIADRGLQSTFGGLCSTSVTAQSRCNKK